MQIPVKDETELFSFDQPDEYERIAPRPQPVIIEETDNPKDGARVNNFIVMFYLG